MAKTGATVSLGGAWKDWIPTLGALVGSFSLGNGTMVAKYIEIGKTVHYRIHITFGSTTTMATLQPTFTLPVATTTYQNSAGTVMGFVHMEDTGTGNAFGVVEKAALNPTTTMTIFVCDTSGTYQQLGNLTTTVPFTWGNTDQINISGTYERA